MMHNDLQENEPQTDEDRQAFASIEALLSGGAQDALIAAAKKQYMLYAPTLLIGEASAPRLQQLWRVCLEFGLGLPRKLFNYWRQAAMAIHPVRRISQPLHLSLFLALAPFVMTLSVPLAIISFIRAFAIAIWNSVVTRTMIFLPLDEYVRRLTGERSP